MKRPKDDDAEGWANVFELCSQFAFPGDSAKALGVRPGTLKKWLARKPELVRKYVKRLDDVAKTNERELLRSLAKLSYGEVRHRVLVIESLRLRWFMQSAEWALAQAKLDGVLEKAIRHGNNVARDR